MVELQADVVAAAERLLRDAAPAPEDLGTVAGSVVVTRRELGDFRFHPADKEAALSLARLVDRIDELRALDLR